MVYEISKFDLSELQAAKDRKDQALKQYYAVESDLRTKENRKKDLARRLDETKERINVAQEKLERMEKIRRHRRAPRRNPRRLPQHPTQTPQRIRQSAAQLCPANP